MDEVTKRLFAALELKEEDIRLSLENEGSQIRFFFGAPGSFGVNSDVISTTYLDVLLEKYPKLVVECLLRGIRKEEALRIEREEVRLTGEKRILEEFEVAWRKSGR